MPDSHLCPILYSGFTFPFDWRSNWHLSVVIDRRFTAKCLVWRTPLKNIHGITFLYNKFQSLELVYYNNNNNNNNNNNSSLFFFLRSSCWTDHSIHFQPSLPSTIWMSYLVTPILSYSTFYYETDNRKCELKLDGWHCGLILFKLRRPIHSGFEPIRSLA